MTPRVRRRLVLLVAATFLFAGAAEAQSRRGTREARERMAFERCLLDGLDPRSLLALPERERLAREDACFEAIRPPDAPSPYRPEWSRRRLPITYL